MGGDAGALKLGGEIPDGWFDVDARLVFKSPRTGRETTVVGPAHARGCVQHEEEAWLTKGTLEGHAGSGDGPGAEQWIVTPHLVVRHLAAEVTVTVSKGQTLVKVAKGAAHLWPSAADAGKDEGWDRLDAGGTRKLEGEPDAMKAGRVCTQLAEESGRLSSAMRDAGSSLGDLAAQHIAARRRAHAACSQAHVLLEEMPIGMARAGLTYRLVAADRIWRSVGGAAP